LCSTFWRKTTIKGLKALQPCSLAQTPPWEMNKFSDCQAPLHFTVPEDLLPSSQESTNCLYSARWIYTIPYYFFKTHFHIILWTECYFICSVGQRFALLEEKAVLSTVLRKFKLESLSRKEEMDLMFQLILRPKHGLKIKITPR